MKVTIVTYETVVNFISEKRNKTYKKYVDVSIAREKYTRVHKFIQNKQFYCLTGRNGVAL